MILTTLNQILAESPCADGWAKNLHARGKIDDSQPRQFLESCDGPANLGELANDKPRQLTSALESNDLDDTLWPLRCLHDNNRLWLKFTARCARQVQPLMTDPRSINALEVADRHVDGLATDQELVAAWVAACDAARHAARDAKKISYLKSLKLATGSINRKSR